MFRPGEPQKSDTPASCGPGGDCGEGPRPLFGRFVTFRTGNGSLAGGGGRSTSLDRCRSGVHVRFPARPGLFNSVIDPAKKRRVKVAGDQNQGNESEQEVHKDEDRLITFMATTDIFKRQPSICYGVFTWLVTARPFRLSKGSAGRSHCNCHPAGVEHTSMYSRYTDFQNQIQRSARRPVA